MDGKNIVKLVNLYQEYFEKTGKEDLTDFFNWYLLTMDSKLTENFDQTEVDRKIAYLINRLSKFSRFYSKKILADFSINSIDEFYFLLSIYKLKNPAKNEVYFDTVTELTTGTQILKRLIAMKLVEEFTDVEDKRIKRVRLTKQGVEIKDAIFNRFTETVKLKTGNLNISSKLELLSILENLNSFHEKVYKVDSEMTVDEIIRKNIY